MIKSQIPLDGFSGPSVLDLGGDPQGVLVAMPASSVFRHKL